PVRSLPKALEEFAGGARGGARGLATYVSPLTLLGWLGPPVRRQWGHSARGSACGRDTPPPEAPQPSPGQRESGPDQDGRAGRGHAGQRLAHDPAGRTRMELPEPSAGQPSGALGG